MVEIREDYNDTVKACLKIYSDSYSVSGYSLINDARDVLHQAYMTCQSGGCSSEEGEQRHLMLVKAYQTLETHMAPHEEEYAIRSGVRRNFLSFMETDAEKAEKLLETKYGESVSGQEDIDEIFNELDDIKEIVETTAAFDLADIVERIAIAKSQLIHVLL